MTSEFSWFMSGHVFLAQIYDIATIEDMRAVNNFSMKCLKSSPLPLYMFVNLTDLHQISVGVNELRQELVFLKNPLLREIEVYGCNQQIHLTVRFLAGLLGELAHVPIRVFDTETQALNFLRRVQQDFESLPL